MMAKKWKAPINSNKNISPINKNRAKVLLSDQLGGWIYNWSELKRM